MSKNFSKDMAICFVVFNPAQTKRMIMNYLYVRNKFELENFPVFTIELIYEGRTPEISNAIHVHTNSYMFHKENLFRILVQHIPQEYQKLAFLDADIFFKDSSWYDDTSKLLETHDVVQPFEIAQWLDLTYTVILLRRLTILRMPTNKWTFDYHPGFAWCMRRDWFEQNGFFDYAVSGGADMLSSTYWLNIEIPKQLSFIPRAIQSAYEKYRAAIQLPRITFLKEMEVYHLYHGWIANRQYERRHKILEIEEDICNLTFKNSEGVLEWKEPHIWNPQFLNYFQQRQDDALSFEARLIKCQTNFVAPPAPAINNAPNNAEVDADSSANK